MELIESGANIVNLLELLFKDRKVDKNMLLCGDRVAASLVIDDLYVVQIHENIAVHYRKGEDEKLRKMARARQTEQLVKNELGDQAQLFLISYVEMEYAQNEATYLENVLEPILDGKIKIFGSEEWLITKFEQIKTD